MTIYLPDALAAEVKAGLTDTNISAVCQAALRVELEREKAMEKIDADGYRRVKLYDGKQEHDIAFRGRKIGSSQKADAWLTPKGTIAVYDHREQELWTYDEYGASRMTGLGQQPAGAGRGGAGREVRGRTRHLTSLIATVGPPDSGLLSEGHPPGKIIAVQIRVPRRPHAVSTA